MKIKKEEFEIRCKLTLIGKKLIESEECERIEWLRNHYLKLVAKDETEWLKLYQDPEDGRYWELRFEYGEMQGGGPPSLVMLTEKEAHSKYNLTKK